MSFGILLESLKFYKLKHDRTLQLWFIILYALNMCIYFLPFVDINFDNFFYFFQQFAETGKLPTPLTGILSAGNWIFIGLSLLMNLVNAFFGLMYATLFVGELSGMTPGQAVMRSLGALPRLMLLIMLMLVPAILSAYLLFMPLIVFVFMMYFTPLLVTLERQKVSEAMHRSFEATRRQKLFIFAQAVLLSMLVSLPRSLILSFIPASIVAVAAAATFFSVILTFIEARLMGFLYIILVKKDQSVLPSKPNDVT